MLETLYSFLVISIIFSSIPFLLSFFSDRVDSNKNAHHKQVLAYIIDLEREYKKSDNDNLASGDFSETLSFTYDGCTMLYYNEDSLAKKSVDCRAVGGEYKANVSSLNTIRSVDFRTNQSGTILFLDVISIEGFETTHVVQRDYKRGGS